MKHFLKVLSGTLVLLLLLTQSCKKDATVTDVTLNESSITLSEGDSFKLIATVHPGNATNQNVSWQSSNEDVATVDNNGLVLAVSVGRATIIVVTEDGNKTANCAVEVVPIATTAVVLNKHADTLGGNETMTLTATVFPENATNKNVTWRSTNTSVATVNNNGLVTTTMNGGTALIIVTTADGLNSDTCRLTVVIPVESVSLNQNTASMGLGETLPLTATILPSTATNRAVTWRSTNESVVTVNSNGVVSAVSLGSASIIVTTADGGKTDTCVVTVVQSVPNCNSNTPGWGTSLGTVGFVSPNTWDFAGLRWSDDVVASNCSEKTTFSVNQSSNFNADCRNNPGFGDLFSWCAMARFKDEICPEGWRVPTRDEFLALDAAIGETGAARFNKYVSDWGAKLGGFTNVTGSVTSPGTAVYYWSQTTATSVANGIALTLTSPNLVNPQHTLPRSIGATIRCVQDL